MEFELQNLYLKPVNRYTFKGSNSVIFIVASHILGASHKGKYMLPYEQIHLIRVDAIFLNLCPPGK